MSSNHPHLHTAKLRKLRPTQMTVGLAEVKEKQSMWKDLAKSERKKFLSHHWFPAVLGPEEDFYIVDHHHLGRALLDVGVEHCQVVLLKDLSQLDGSEFWTVMELCHTPAAAHLPGWTGKVNAQEKSLTK